MVTKKILLTGETIFCPKKFIERCLVRAQSRVRRCTLRSY